MINPQSANTAQLCLKTVLKVIFEKIINFVQILIRALCATFLRRNSMHIQTCRCFKSAKKLGSANCKSKMDKSANHKKYWVCKSQMCKMPHLRKVRKSNKLLSPQTGDFVICGLYFANCPPLLFISAVRLTEREL
jgi:hypothetical protein